MKQIFTILITGYTNPNIWYRKRIDQVHQAERKYTHTGRKEMCVTGNPLLFVLDGDYRILKVAVQ